MTFYRALLPPCYSPGTECYPVMPVDIVRSASGLPVRRARRSEPYMQFNVTFDTRTQNDVNDVIAHYRTMQGALHSFPMRDKFDFKSCKPENTISNLDALLGYGDGATVAFQIKKQYTVTLTDASSLAIDRTIKVIKENTLTVAVDGVAQVLTTDYTVNLDTGVITFEAGSTPASGQAVTCGYEFYVPVCYGPSNPVQAMQGRITGQVHSIVLYEAGST